ncbi:MAG: endo-1,4-beta-xylanase, partial [Lachnospiraceae bacterium]|nr:endo-1,4-beta-xylanase [Lachnospiraceae bacterium]
CKNDATQANYYYGLMKGILELKQGENGDKISGITYWGMGDDRSWRKEGSPLLFSLPGVAKPAYYKVLQAYVDAGLSIQE